MTWFKNCVIIDDTTRDADANAYPPVLEIRAETGPTFKITGTKLYVPAVTLSTEDDNELLEQLKTGLKKTIKWNKYRPEIFNQTKTNNLNYLIDPTFSRVNRLSVLSFENEKDIKDFNVLIDGKRFFVVPIKNKEETYQKIIEMNKNNDYTTGNLLEYE